MFHWKNLPRPLVHALGEGLRLTAPSPEEALRLTYGSQPKDDFLRVAWPVLQSHWLKGDDAARRAVVADLRRLRIGDYAMTRRSPTAEMRYLRTCRSTPLMRKAVLKRFKEAFEAPARDQVSRNTSEDLREIYRSTGYRVLLPTTRAIPVKSPHPHQLEAWAALSAHRPLRGCLLVLPTGAGKTFTTVRWLLSNVLSDGPRPARPVLWLAHRAILLQQAADELAAHVNDAQRDLPLRIRVISSAHQKPATALVAPADVVLATVQSLARRPDLVERYFEANPDAFVVVDEAHHVAATMHRKILDVARRKPEVEILGLTATPTRTNQGEIHLLLRYFPAGVVYGVDQARLIREGVLARPIIESVDTGMDFERTFTPADWEYLTAFGDLSPAALERIARDAERNRLIVDRYRSFRAGYGKTIVFATSIAHCVTLAHSFDESGVAAGYVASKRDDGLDNHQVLDDFRTGRIDVLVSVAILTEGYDSPDTQSVFLARPTGSPILLRQMIGRGMRGPKAGGGPDVRLVSFNDHWNGFSDWLQPVRLFENPRVASDPAHRPSELEGGETPWGVYQQLVRLATEDFYVLKGEPALGWYDLGLAGLEPVASRAVLVWPHQQQAFNGFLKDLGRGRANRNPMATYFGDTPNPRPQLADLAALAEHVDRTGTMPTWIPFVDRSAFNPVDVAERLGDLPYRELFSRVEELFEGSPQAQAQYSTLAAYWDAVKVALDRELLPGVDDAPREGVDLTARMKRRLPPGDHKLEDLLVTAATCIPAPLTPTKTPKVRWSKGLMKSWAFHRSDDGPAPEHGLCSIVVNSRLQTRAVSGSTLTFLLYHELLHHVLGDAEGHSPAFRGYERRFVGYEEAEAELDTLSERYFVGAPGRRSLAR